MSNLTRIIPVAAEHESDNGNVREEQKGFDFKRREKGTSNTRKPFCYREPRETTLRSQEEKRLVWLIDIHMLPCICGLYCLNHLDRSNIANARIGGMSLDLNLSSTDYSLAVLIFFLGYILAEIPSNMMMPQLRPSIFLSLLTFSWGLVAACFSLVQTKQALISLRFLLGLIESGFFPGLVYYLSSWYRKRELAKRIGLLYSAAICSGAFGGLLAGTVIANLDGALGIRGWRWIFVIEGCVTILASFVVVFFLPDWPSNTRWLSPEQRMLAEARLNSNTLVSSQGTEYQHLSHLQALKAALLDWRTHVFGLMYTLVSSANMISYFIPAITLSMGYTGEKAQFMTVPIYVCAMVAIIGISFSADHFDERALHIGLPSFIAGSLYTICIWVHEPKARYGILCISYGLVQSAVPLILAWTSQHIKYPDSKRAVSQAYVNTVGSAAAFYGSFLWSKPPHFTTGFIALMIFCFGCVICVIFAHFFLGRELIKEKELVDKVIQRENLEMGIRR